MTHRTLQLSGRLALSERRLLAQQSCICEIGKPDMHTRNNNNNNINMEAFQSLAIDGKSITRIRRPVQGKPAPLDGYIDATLMCQAAGKLWGDYWRNAKTKAYVKVLEADMGIPISALIVSIKGGNDKDEQGTWVHPRAATHLAAWCSPEFDVAVHNLIDRYRRGDITLISEVLTNHDEDNGTVSRAFVQTIPANSSLIGERAKSIRATKECGEAIRVNGFPTSLYAIKSNAVNQAAKGFSCTTSQYKKDNGIRTNESLREYFAAPNQLAVSLMETALATKFAEPGAKHSDAMEFLVDLKRKMSDICEMAGMHKIPLLKEPFKKQISQQQQHAANERPQTRKRHKALPTTETQPQQQPQAQHSHILNFFAPATVHA